MFFPFPQRFPPDCEFTIQHISVEPSQSLLLWATYDPFSRPILNYVDSCKKKIENWHEIDNYENLQAGKVYFIYVDNHFIRDLF